MQFSRRIFCRWQFLVLFLAVGSTVASTEPSSPLTSLDRRLRIRGGVRGGSSSTIRASRRLNKKSDSADSSKNDGKKNSKNIFAEEELVSSFDTEFKGNYEASSDEEGGEIATTYSMDDVSPTGMLESNHTSDSLEVSDKSSSNTPSSRKNSSRKSSNKLSKVAKKRKYSSRSKVKDSNKLKMYGSNNMNSFDDEAPPLLESSSNDRPITPTLSPVASTPEMTPTPSQAPPSSTNQPTRGSEPTNPPQTETLLPTSSPPTSLPTGLPTSLPTKSPISNPSTSGTVPTIAIVRPTQSPTVNQVPTITEVPISEGIPDNDNALVEWDCPTNVVQLQTEIEVDYIGSPELLTAEEISSLERTFSTLYNTETLLMCDTYARTIINSELQFSNGNGGFVFSISAVCRDCPADTNLLQEDTPIATKTSTTDSFTFSLQADFFSQLTTGEQQKRSSSSSQSYFGFFEEVTETVKSGKKGSRNLQVFDTCFCPAGVEPTTPMAPTKEEFLTIQNQAIEQLREAGILTNVEGISRLGEL